MLSKEDKDLLEDIKYSIQNDGSSNSGYLGCITLVAIIIAIELGIIIYKL